MMKPWKSIILGQALCEIQPICMKMKLWQMAMHHTPIWPIKKLSDSLACAKKAKNDWCSNYAKQCNPIEKWHWKPFCQNQCNAGNPQCYKFQSKECSCCTPIIVWNELNEKASANRLQMWITQILIACKFILCNCFIPSDSVHADSFALWFWSNQMFDMLWMHL